MMICRLHSFPYLRRLDSLIAKARFALSVLDREDFIESFEATLANVESELKQRERPT